MADDVIALMDEVGWPQAHVLGMSMGGMVALDLAVEHPHRVKSLILGGTTHGGQTSIPPSSSFFRVFSDWDDTSQEAQRSCLENFIGYMLPPHFRDRPGGEAMYKIMVNKMLETSKTRDGLAMQTAALSRFDMSGRLGEVRSPALIVHGSEDRVLDPANGVSIAANMDPSLARLEVLPGAGHFWWAQNPIKTAALLIDFLIENDEQNDGT